MARSAGCSVRTVAPYTLSTRKLGMVHIQEYQISSSCTVFNPDNQPAGVGTIKSHRDSNHMGFAYSQGNRGLLLSHLRNQ